MTHLGSTDSLVGPAVAERVARAANLGAGPPAGEVTLGWATGELPLRPLAAEVAHVREAFEDHRDRPFAWVVADLADPLRMNDAHAAAVAEGAERLLGAGLCYLGGIGWGAEGAALHHSAVGRLLRSARVRLWWDSEHLFDPLRAIESLEHGCLPVQVTSPERVRDARKQLPRQLAALVVDLDGLADLDLSAAHTTEQLQLVAGLMLAGCLERDLATNWAFGGLTS